MVKPEGTYRIWLDCRDLGMNSEKLEQFMLKQAKIGLDGEAGSGPEANVLPELI